MAVGSNVNPNYPIPGIDQSSKGFRDNFSTIKVEIENLQSKQIELTGDATGNAYIGNGSGEVVINTKIINSNTTAGGTNRTVQYNHAGTLAGDAEFYWDAANVLVIGTQIPDSGYMLDSQSAKIHQLLTVQGDGGQAVLSIAGGDSNYPAVSLTSAMNSGVGQANLNVANADATTIDTLNIQFNGVNAAQFNANGMAVGAVYLAAAGGPTSYLEVYADGQADIANYLSTYENSDNGIRVATSNENSTVGIVLQQDAADSVAGIRIGRYGNLSLHTGLNNGANLDDSSIVVLVDTSGRMGVGITAPQQRLDVDGSIQWNLPNSANVAPQSAGEVGVAVDSWDVGIYRSADYTVQVEDAVGLIEITKLLVMHQSGTAYQYVYANLNSVSGSGGPPSLGTFVASMTGSTMQLIYEGVANGNTVKVDATYITI